VILFCTEALFYLGVSLFLYIAHVQQLLQAPASARSYGGSLLPSRPPVGYRVSMIISVALGVVLPAISFGVVWPWTGPAAAAALLPYLIGLAVQLGFEKFVIAKKSPVWSMVPITFQVCRSHPFLQIQHYCDRTQNLSKFRALPVVLLVDLSSI
jgi:hypothetical protein